MTKLLRLCLSALLPLITTTAPLADELTPSSAYVYATAKSKYVLGSGVLASPSAVLQGGTTVSWKNGVYVDLWGSGPFSSKADNSYGNEMDTTAGWLGEIGKAKIDAGIAHYNLYPVGKIDKFDLFDIFAEISPKDGILVGEKSTITPFARVELLKSSGRNISAAVIYGGIYNNIPLGDGWAFDQKVRVGSWSNIASLSAGYIGYYKAEVSRTLENGLRIGVYAERYQPFSMDGGRVPNTIFGVNVGMNF